MRTPITSVMLIVSLFAAPLALAETQTAVSPAKPEARGTATPTTAPTATTDDATAQQVAMQLDTPRNNALRNIKVYPCF